MKRFLSCLTPALTGLAVISLASAATADNLILNGGFETNNGVGTNSFISWTVFDGPGSGTWFVQTGTSAPVNTVTVPVPPEGAFAAMTDSTGPGSHVLYQDFVVPSDLHGAALSFSTYLHSSAAFLSPDTLSTGTPNQQARIDIMTTTADRFSVIDGDVLLNVFRTQPGDPLTSGYTARSADVSSLLLGRIGQTLRLRIAEADDQSAFQFGVDSVVLSTTTPEPGAYALFVSSGLAGAGFLIRRRCAHK